MVSQSVIPSKQQLGGAKPQSPLGDELWQINIAKECGIESTLNPRGRPWKKD